MLQPPVSLVLRTTSLSMGFTAEVANTPHVLSSTVRRLLPCWSVVRLRHCASFPLGFVVYSGFLNRESSDYGLMLQNICW
ncbi:hypothetical protein CDAR_45361 [Caerostris darwini]|uniref:Secreted protein n=1 Tax=Caerostris darwini TaxID=1538125 RepID=A0AAV4SYH5_9ARAC|nr:hypothetical protein CDAR_45361 [Caerostris darwini]